MAQFPKDFPVLQSGRWPTAFHRSMALMRPPCGRRCCKQRCRIDRGMWGKWPNGMFGVELVFVSRKNITTQTNSIHDCFFLNQIKTRPTIAWWHNRSHLRGCFLYQHYPHPQQRRKTWILQSSCCWRRWPLRMGRWGCTTRAAWSMWSYLPSGNLT